MVHPGHPVLRAGGRGLLRPGKQHGVPLVLEKLNLLPVSDRPDRRPERLLGHYRPRRLGHLLVHQRAAHPRDTRRQGQDLHLCRGGRREPGQDFGQLKNPQER